MTSSLLPIWILRVDKIIAFLKAPKYLAGCILALFALSLTSCASPPQEQVSYLELQQASRELLRKAIYVRVLAEQCSETTYEGRFEQHYNTWIEQHWPLIVGADAFWVDSLKNRIFVVDGKPLAGEAVSMMNKYRQDAESRFGRLHLRTSDRDRNCNKYISDYAAPPALSDTVRRELLNYRNRHQYPPTMNHQVPTLGGQFFRGSTPGRSQFEFERFLVEKKCMKPQVYTLLNGWPNEAYLGFCGDSLWLLKCEWGECEQRSLHSK